MNSRFPRRQFLHTGTVALAGLGVRNPSCLKRSLRVPQRQYLQRSRPLRHDRYRHAGLRPAANAIGLPGIECVAAADLYDGRHTLAKQITNNSSLPTTRRYQELLDRKDIDCIVAAVPDHWHKRVVVDACNAGKDIYCEKPMSHTIAEGYEMVDAAKRNGRIVQIGSQRVSSVCARKLANCITAPSARSRWSS